MNTPPTVAPREWEAARQRLLVKEKELTRARDALAAERRRMPWLRVDKDYLFDGPNGRMSLLDLFEGRRQLIVYRAFFEPGVFGWPDHACRGRSPGGRPGALSPPPRPRVLGARRVRLARPRLPRLLPGGRPGRSRRPSARPGHHSRLRLARAAAGDRADEGSDGLDDALVHDDRRLRRRLRCGRVARHECVHP